MSGRGTEHRRLHERVVAVFQGDVRQRRPRLWIVPFAQAECELIADPNARVIHQPQQCRREIVLGRLLQERFAEQDTDFPHRRIVIPKGSNERLRCQHPQSLHGAEGLQPPLGIRVLGDSQQLADGRPVRSPNQEPLRHVSFPAVGAGQSLTELRRTELIQPGNRT